MTVENLEKIIFRLEKLSKRNSNLYKLGLDLTEYENDFHELFNLLLSSFVTEDAEDWFYWFIFEKEYGKRSDMKAFDKDGTEICKDIKGLHKLMFGK